MIFVNTDLFLSGLLSGTGLVYAKVIAALSIFGFLLLIDNLTKIKSPVHLRRLKKFSLIDGVFTTEDASEVLGQFFTEKIRFHEQRKADLLPQKGERGVFSENRLNELKKDQTEFIETIIHAQLAGKNLKITSNIEVELVDDEPTLQESKILEKVFA